MSHTYIALMQEAAQRTALITDRYNWLRENPAWETEAYLGGLSPDEFDAAVDKARGATE